MILVWGFIYDPNVGVLNAILRAFGMQGAAWLGEPWLALPSIIGIGFPWIGAMSLLDGIRFTAQHIRHHHAQIDGESLGTGEWIRAAVESAHAPRE